MSYQLPSELEPFRALIGNTGGNTVEDLIGRLDDPYISQTNAIVFTMAISVDEQVKLLRRLNAKGMLSPPVKDSDLVFGNDYQQQRGN